MIYIYTRPSYSNEIWVTMGIVHSINYQNDNRNNDIRRKAWNSTRCHVSVSMHITGQPLYGHGRIIVRRPSAYWAVNNNERHRAGCSSRPLLCAWLRSSEVVTLNEWLDDKQWGPWWWSQSRGELGHGQYLTSLDSAITDQAVRSFPVARWMVHRVFLREPLVNRQSHNFDPYTLDRSHRYPSCCFVT